MQELAKWSFALQCSAFFYSSIHLLKASITAELLAESLHRPHSSEAIHRSRISMEVVTPVVEAIGCPGVVVEVLSHTEILHRPELAGERRIIAQLIFTLVGVY